ncbi:MAG: DUF3052 family protein [Hyphomicrobiales bacterium]|nr:DUF3052 family protein [Hyphomicrobiales bacterium]
MSGAAAGYSGKPLPTKLGFKPGMRAAFIALPVELAALAAWDDFATVERFDDWSAALPSRSFDLIHAFTKSRTDLTNELERLQGAIQSDGMIWVSWPKKASKVPTDVTEDVVRAEALALDLVDVKVAAVDHIWSALKLVIRKHRR